MKHANNQINLAPNEKAIGIAILTATALFFFFFDLHRPDLLLWDESRLAVNALEMAESGNYLVTSYEGEPDTWNTKPPLAIWLMTLSVKLLGTSEFSIRLPAAISGLLTTLMLYAFCAVHLKNHLMGLAAGFILITSTGYVAEHVTRTADYDGILTFFTTAYILAFYLWVEEERNDGLIYLVVFTASLILAVLTKGIAGLIPLPGLALWVLIRGRMAEALRRPETYLAIFMCIFVVLSYYLLRESQNPGYLDAVIDNEIYKGLRTDEQHEGSPFFYIEYFLGLKLIPWIYLIPVSVSYLVLRAGTREKRLCLYLTICAIFYLLVISNAATKLPWYDAPVYPLFAVISGFAVAKAAVTAGDYVSGRSVSIFQNLVLIAIVAIPFYNMARGIYDNKGVIYEWSRLSNSNGHYWNHQIMYGNYLKTVTFQRSDIAKIFIDEPSYNAHLRFYIMTLADAGPELIRTKGLTHYASGDVVLSCDPARIEALKQAYDAQIIDESTPMCRMLEVTPAR